MWTRSVIAAFLAFLFAVAAAPAQAGSAQDQCRVERQAFAKAACLEQIFEQRYLGMVQDIQDLLSRLQAATVPELLALGRQYDGAQARWRDEVAEACRDRHPSDTVGFQYCRLGTVEPREEQLALSLERAAEDFGAPPEYEVPIPDAIEILIPLPVDIPFGGEARLPLVVPLHPQ